MAKTVLLSGIKPTGRPHIGNYFGAMRQFVNLHKSGKYDCYFFLADYHALNLIQNAEEMKRLTLDLAIDYLAIFDEDVEKPVIFKQSDVSAHTELTAIFDTLITVPYLMRAHAFKDAINKAKLTDEEQSSAAMQAALQSKIGNQGSVELNFALEKVARLLSGINVGTFNYPVLMAADILLYDDNQIPVVVPVGQDQKQHLEYARDIAQKFNNTYGELFKLPEPIIFDQTAIVPGIDGRKMSKSYGNTIPLFASREEIQKAVMGIVTDSSDETPINVYNIHKLFRSEAELKTLYDANKGKYKALKEALIEDIDAFIKPMRERRAELAKDEKKVMKILEEGAKKANEKASIKLIEAKKKIGVL